MGSGPGWSLSSWAPGCPPTHRLFSPTGPTAPWSPAHLPATVCYRHCTRSRLEQPLPVRGLDWDKLCCSMPSAQAGLWQGGSPGACVCVLCVQVCASCWDLGPCVSLLDGPCHAWGAHPWGRSSKAALPLNSLPFEGALLVCASHSGPCWLCHPTPPTFSSHLGCPKAGELPSLPL